MSVNFDMFLGSGSESHTFDWLNLNHSNARIVDISAVLFVFLIFLR